jgi:uncharacterized protein YndB with AHSA1/START domain
MLTKILITVVIAVALAVAGLAAMIAHQPSKFSVSRSTPIAASPVDVFSEVNDFRNWEAWWRRDASKPALRATLEGPAAGKGAILRWSGNDDEGSMTILESQPPTQIKTRLAIVRPDPWTADMVFGFAPEGSGTTVTWTWTGENDFLLKAMVLFILKEDKVIGPELERGLAQIKAIAEQKK